MAEGNISDSSSEDEWEEEAESECFPCFCLFCSRVFDDGAFAVLDHCSQEHGFQLLELVSRLGKNEGKKSV